MAFLLVGARKRVPVYECFIEGAKEGFDIARNLLPYLVAMLCAIGVLRASGALDVALDAIRWVVHAAGLDARFVDALPTALVKPFSGSAARAMLIETMRSEEHTSELQSLMRISYAFLCLKKKQTDM